MELQQTSQEIYKKKYQLKDDHQNPVDEGINDTFKRVAWKLSEQEKDREYWYEQFLWALQEGATPAGRILANAGAEKYKPNTSNINCTVSQIVEDDISGILEANMKAGETLSGGAGIGYEMSTLRPEGAFVNGAGAFTNGPLSFMDIFDSMCFTIASAGGRRGAQMSTFAVWHPDIKNYIEAKKEDRKLRQFNLSILVDEEFVEAVKNNEKYALGFPVRQKELDKGIYSEDKDEFIWRKVPWEDWYCEKMGYIYSDDGHHLLFRVWEWIDANDLWNQMMKSTYDYAEPGIIFIDRYNRENNNWFCEKIRATNPCFTGDTEVFTIDGFKRFDELAKNNEDVKVLTQDQSGNMIYSWMRSPHKTAESQPLVKIRFRSNGNNVSEIRCTPDHKFILSNGEQVEAKNLKTNHSVFSVSFYKVNQRHFPSTSGLHEVVDVEFIEDKEDVYNGMVEYTHCYFVRCGENHAVLAKNCGEQGLPPNGACLLGSVNIARFIEEPFTENAYINWDKFHKVVRIFTRMLDNVVEFNGLPLQEQRDEIERKRRHGMGFMGLGSAFSMLGIRYGSDESIELTEEISKQLAIDNYEVGIEIAEEKGPAPIFKESGSKENWCNSQYMQRIWSERPDLEDKARKVGCRFTHATSTAPTGCVTGDTLITTESGFAHISDLGDTQGSQWQDISFRVSTDDGYKNATKFYLNGLSPTIEIKTSRGQSIRATEDHKVRVFDDKEGYTWKTMLDIKNNDVIVSIVNDYNGGQYQELKPYKGVQDFCNKKSHFYSPTMLDEDIAEFLGFLFSNGNIKYDSRVVRLYHHKDYSEKVFYRMKSIIKSKFGLESKEVDEDRIPNLKSIEVNSTPLIEWMRINEIDKDKSDNISLPKAILSSPRSVIEAFFRGYFEGDGTASNSSVAVTSVSKKFLQESQVVLQALGIVSRMNISGYGSDKNRKGDKDLYRLSIGNIVDKKRFFDRIGFISNKGRNVKETICNKNYNNGYRQIVDVIKKPFKGYYDTNSDHNITRKIREFMNSFDVEVVLDYVEKVEHHVDVVPTYDLSVPDNTTYSANGVISHNTIALSINNNVSNGIEPTFSHKYTRNVIEEGRKTKRAVDVYSYEMLMWNHLTGEERVPEWFSTADDVSTYEHVKIQAAAQKWVDSSISKTVNVPTEMPFEEFKDLYLYAYEQGLKGLATFRFNPEAFQGVLVREDDLENTTYTFVTEDGERFNLKGNEKVQYDGEVHTAANLYEALKEGTYGKY